MPPLRRRCFPSMLMHVLVVMAMTTVRGDAAATASGESNAVFCTDVGIDFAVQRRNSALKEAAMGDEKDAVATSCLRHPVVMAAVGHLAAKMPAFALSAVDCVHEAVSEKDAAFFAVLSLCSRPNIQHQANNVNAWDVDVRAQLQQVVGAEGNHDKVVIDAGKNVAVQVRQVLVSPSYTLLDGKGMPRFEFQGAELRHDADGATKVDVSVRNVGKVPLHLYRATLTELLEGATKGASPPATLALLASPAVIGAGKSASVEFTSSAASSVTTLVSTKSYAIYISHSGFRSHRFDGALDGEILKTTNAVISSSTEKTTDVFFGGIVSHASTLDPMMTPFPYGSWQVLSVGIVVVVGVAAMMYIRRKWPRRISACLQRSFHASSTSGSPKSAKMKNASGWKKSKRSDVGMSDEQTLSDRELDELESERLMASPPSSTTGQVKKPRQSTTREKMPAIQMQWTPPPSTSGSFRKSLELDETARLDPKRFESMWEEYHQRYQSNEVQTGRVDSTALVEKMQARGVTCMASGTVNGVEKYVFYTKQRASRSDWFLFLVVDITLATSNLGVTVRTSSDASESLVEEFVEMAKATLGDALEKS